MVTDRVTVVDFANSDDDEIEKLLFHTVILVDGNDEDKRVVEDLLITMG